MKKAIYSLGISCCVFWVHAQQPDCGSTDFYIMGHAANNWGNSVLKFNLDSPSGPVSYNGSTDSENVIGPQGPFISNIELSGTPSGLAIADFGAGKQFYASYHNFTSNEFGIADYNGDEWVSFLSDAFCNQLGGNGEHLYLQSHKLDGYIENDRIDYFNGTELITVWESQGDEDRLMAADITVDDNGNAYFFTGQFGSGMTDTLHILSPGGDMVAEMPVEVPSSGSAGSFFMYDTLYLYSGINLYLLPIQISSSGAVKGDPISIPNIYLATNPNNNVYFHGIDAATCASANIQLSSKDFSAETKAKIYPNPVNEKLIFESEKAIDRIEIFDVTGKRITAQTLNALQGNIDVQFLSPGVYLIRLIYPDKKTETHKFIKN